LEKTTTNFLLSLLGPKWHDRFDRRNHDMPKKIKKETYSADFAAARNPNTPPDELQRISEQGWTQNAKANNELVSALLMNPNTPPQLLAGLAEKNCAALCRNPILPLIPLEMPDFPTHLTPYTRQKLVMEPHIPRALLALFCNDVDPITAAGARQHITLAGEIPLEKAGEEIMTFLHRLATDVPPGPGRAAHRELVEYGFAPAWAAAFPPESDEDKELPEIDSRLSPTRREMVRAILGIANSDRSVLDCVSPVVRAALDPVAEPHALQRWAEDQDWAVRLAVAANPNTPKATLQQLNKHIYRNLNQAALIRNPNTPQEVLAGFASGSCPTLRRAVRRRPEALPEWKDAAHAALRNDLDRWCVRPKNQHDYPYLSPGWGPTSFCQMVALWHFKGKDHRARVRVAAESPDFHDRLAAALAPPLAIAYDVRTRLQNDGNRYVRVAARARLSFTVWKG
jgi:hypothetical protein